ncbi:unnamed protein product [Phaedon cochleariae]|uniref:Nucleoprotein n=1 Tax=Phaedon cochleariae TaxID=80249 RepID=A0A9N9SEV1_PHACE|nr:unnamed protein product [Phaedon cochleariae]
MSVSQDVTYQKAVELVGSQNNTDATTAYSMAGMLPMSIANHTVERYFIICGVLPGDYASHHGAGKFELATLQTDFKTICTDYLEELEADTRSYAADFCSKVIYEVGPESRKGDKKTDKVWKLRFMYKASTGALDVSTLFIATYRDAAYGSNFPPNKSMCVTVKQARLLAMDVFDRLATYALKLPNSLVLLTPLAGSIFSTDDIAKIAQDIGVTPIQVLCAINNSCQSGGRSLSDSAEAAKISCSDLFRTLQTGLCSHFISTVHAVSKQ